MSTSVMVAEVIPRATASTLRTICWSTDAVVPFGFVCEPPSSAASRAPCRTAEPDVTLSEIIMLASKPPIRRKKMTGIATASSASDCPPRCRCPPSWRSREDRSMLVALRLEPDVIRGGGLDRAQRLEEARLPAIGEFHGDAQEVAAPVADIARGRLPGLGGQERRSVGGIPVEQGRVRREVPVAILVELVDVNLVHREEAVGAGPVADDLERLGIGRGGVAQLGRLAGSLHGGIAGGAHAEHQQATVEHAKNQDEEDRDDQRKLDHGLTEAPRAPPPPLHNGQHYNSSQRVERLSSPRPPSSGKLRQASQPRDFEYGRAMADRNRMSRYRAAGPSGETNSRRR